MSNPSRALSVAQSSSLATRHSRTAGARPLSTWTSARSPSSSAPPPPPRNRRTHPDDSLYRKVVRTAVLGAYENSAPSQPPPYLIRPHGFKPEKLRNTPSSQQGKRAKLVEFDPQRVLQNGYSKKSGRRGSIPNGKRVFSTCARRERASEETLELEESSFDVEGGDWDGKGDAAAISASRARMPKPGDWVETRRNGAPYSGIYLSPGIESARRFMILPVSGERTELSLDDITYVLPGVISPALASSASFRNAPDFSPSTPQALEMLQKLREIEFAVEEEAKLLVSRGVDDLYRILHSPPSPSPSPAAQAQKRPPSPPSSITITSALKALRLPSTTPSSLMSSHAVPLARQIAMHRVLLDNAVHFLADGLALRVTGKFDLRDPHEAKRFEQVRDWTRQQSSEMMEFAKKAAKVREWGRLHPVDEAKAGGPISARELPRDAVGTLEWTEEDQEILRFLRDTLAYDRVIQTQPHMAVAPSILKFVDQESVALGHEGWGDDSEVKKARIREFLAEVGEVAPWENWAALEKTAGLAGWEATGIKVERALKRGKSATSKDKARTLSSTEFYPQDPHDSVRHDFGNVPVFTIDDVGAFELDDGISLSPAQPPSTGKTTHWIHVHVADPTALVHPNHLVAKLARVRDHSEYFPEKTWSMLPDNFVEKEMLSLGSQGGAEQRVMSFGMRIEEETGEILEREVKVGVVRRILRLTYAGVDEALGHPPPPPKQTIQHPAASILVKGAGNKPNIPRRRHIDDDLLKTDPEAVPALQTLHRIAQKLLARRAADSALFWNFPSAGVLVSPSTAPSFATSARPTFYSTSPVVNLHLPSRTQESFVDSPASLLVSELMVAANRTAARFSVENGFPVPFRSQGRPSATPEAIEAVLKLRNPATGQAPAVEVLKKGLDFLPGLNTPTAGPHWPMGINDDYGYLKVTSPLRRYSDLFSHWQIKSALLPSSSAPSYATPRFDLPSVLSHIQGFDVAAKARHRLSDAASTFWSLFVISRKLDLLNRISSRTNNFSASDISPEDHDFVNLLAGGLTAIPLRSASHSAFDNLHVQPVLIPQLGVRGTLQVEKLDMTAPVGEEVEVKIDEVILSARSKVVVSRR